MMKRPNKTVDIDELSRFVERLDGELSIMRRSGGPTVQELQQMANRLTELQLLLNELQRVCTEGNGERVQLAELDGRLRLIRGALYDELRRDGNSMSNSA